MNADYYDPKTTANFNVQDQYAETTKGLLTAFNYTNLKLTFNHSYFNVYKYWYDLVWSIPPYNILTVRAVPQEQIEQNNLFFHGNNPYIVHVRADDCSLTASNHLKTLQFPCSLAFKQVNINISTDKNSYEDGESITVIVEPYDYSFNLSYAGVQHEIRGGVVLTAKYPYNRIIIGYNDRSYDKIIYVGRTKYLYLFFSLVIFVSILYALIYVLRKYWGASYE